MNSIPMDVSGTDRLGVAVIGSTGSIGSQTLDVLRFHRDRFDVVSLASRRDTDRLRKQVQEFRPRLVVTEDETDGLAPPAETRVASGSHALVEAATHPDADIVVIATSGHAGIQAALEAASAGKILAIANKETIVCAGELLFSIAHDSGSQIRPVDSEHSAIWQAIGGSSNDVDRIILTASGGPFADYSVEDLGAVTISQALAHPTWSMGGKVTIDSATMMNKGLEILEASWLFDIDLSRIDVLIHRQSIVHSLVEFRDGSQRAQLGLPDMRQPIQYALTCPSHLVSSCPRLDLSEVGTLTFERVNSERFPAIQVAREVGRLGGSMPTALSAADDIAVTAFLSGRIGFTDILPFIQVVLDSHELQNVDSLETILEVDSWARTRSIELLNAAFPE